MAFALNCYPVVYRAKFVKGKWKGEYLEQPHKTPGDEAALPVAQQAKLSESRNFFADMPLVGYTSQYGLGCFEGLKALPQKDGGLSLFRPDQNAARFTRSMKGLYMPPFPEELFVKSIIEVIKRNAKLGFRVFYEEEWEKDSFASASSVYVRPFSYSEGGLGVNISREPYVLIVLSPVSAYFSGGADNGAVVTNRYRATPNGTGWIKAASNYTIAALAKHEAVQAGFMECIFLDSVHSKYIEEGSSCNAFFYLKSGELVTPALGDTILPGITRSSIIELARDRKIKVTERKIAIEEVMTETKECFLCGTAVGATPLTAITYKKKKVIFNKGKTGELTATIRDVLKGIQYGTIPDKKGWMVKVPVAKK